MGKHHSSSIEYYLDLFERPEVRAAHEAMRVRDRWARATQAEHRALRMSEHLRPIQEDITRMLSWLPLPSPLSKIEREARTAWKEYPEGNTKPLDCFIVERLGLTTKKAATPSDELRRRTWELLNDCFLSVPGYASGEWFALGNEEEQKLSALIREKLSKVIILCRAVERGACDDADLDLEQEVPVAVALLWPANRHGGKQQRGGRTQSLRKAVSEYLAQQVAVDNPASPPFLDDNAAAEFESREVAARQEASVLLRKMVEEAGFSRSEDIVYRIDLRNADKTRATKIAARALKVKHETVRTFRKRYMDKLREIADG
jgi:hypothetical protein